MIRTLMAVTLFLLHSAMLHAQCPIRPPFDEMLLGASDFSGTPMKIALDEGPIASSPTSPVSPAIYSQRKVWQSTDNVSPVLQLIDIRIVFTSEEQASEFIETRIDFLSEKAPKESEVTVEGVDVTVYGPRNQKAIDWAAKYALPPEVITAYVYIFQYQNVVGKVFIKKRPGRAFPMTSRSVLPLVATTIRKTTTYCSSAGKH